MGVTDFVADAALENIVNVVAAEMRVAVGGEHLVDVALAGGNQLEDGDVKGAAAEVIHGDAAALLLVEAEGQRGGRGLVDQAQDFEAGEASGVFGGLALRVVEIRGDGDDRALHGLPKKSFRPVAQLAKNERGDFRRREDAFAQAHADDAFAAGINPEGKDFQLVLNVGDAAAHQALDGIDGAAGLREQTAARGFADDDAAVFVEADDGRTERAAIRAADTLRPARPRIEIGDEAVGGAEINADGASHSVASSEV